MRFQILSTALQNNKFIISENISNDENIYTLITGKNGLGKTRLLNFIIYHFIKDTYRNSYYGNDQDINIFKKITDYQIYSTTIPNKIIVHTNSKFDKFPNNYQANTKNYININKSHQYSDSDEIFYKILFGKNLNFKSVNETLSYLNYTSVINFDLSLKSAPSSAGYLEKMVKEYNLILKELNYDLNKSPQKHNKYNKKFLNLLFLFHERKIIPSLEELKILYDLVVYKRIYENHLAASVNLKENKYNYSYLDKHEFLLLVKYNLITIYSIYLHNDSNNSLFSSTKEKVSFYNLSSGQKSIINTLLGISSVIENNSLVCIDEPEISLHPEWQEEIIQKLQEVFFETKGCHFLIATHSPQVVSGLKSKNGFILELENNITYKSIDYSKKSADYQLAKIFNSPGYNNEYILKLCFYFLSIIKEDKSLSEADIELLQELDNFRDNLKIDDPSLYLINQVQSFLGR